MLAVSVMVPVVALGVDRGRADVFIQRRWKLPLDRRVTPVVVREPGQLCRRVIGMGEVKQIIDLASLDYAQVGFLVGRRHLENVLGDPLARGKVRRKGRRSDVPLRREVDGRWTR